MKSIQEETVIPTKVIQLRTWGPLFYKWASNQSDGLAVYFKVLKHKEKGSDANTKVVFVNTKYKQYLTL